MDYYGKWANQILVGYFHVVLVRTAFGKENEHIDNFGIENEVATGDFSKEMEYVI